MFDTKIAVVLRDDLLTWQALNVNAFLVGGLVAQTPGIIGKPYEDLDGNRFNPLIAQPIIILSAGSELLTTIHGRCITRGITVSAYVEEMFSTGDDVANREVFSQFGPDNAKVVGIAMRADRKIVDKITKGASKHT